MTAAAAATTTDTAATRNAPSSVSPSGSMTAIGDTASTVLKTANECTTIWEFADAVVKCKDCLNRPIWRCLHCGDEFKSINATKAMYHITKQPGKCRFLLCFAEVS